MTLAGHEAINKFRSSFYVVIPDLTITTYTRPTNHRLRPVYNSGSYVFLNSGIDFRLDDLRDFYRWTWWRKQKGLLYLCQVNGEATRTFQSSIYKSKAVPSAAGTLAALQHSFTRLSPTQSSGRRITLHAHMLLYLHVRISLWFSFPTDCNPKRNERQCEIFI